MKKIIILKHQNEMKYSREFFQMELPKELSFIVYVIVSICLIIFSIIIFGRIDDVIKTISEKCKKGQNYLLLVTKCQS